MLPLFYSHCKTISVGQNDYQINSIKKAIELAADGDSILIYDAIYREGNIIINKGNGILGLSQERVDEFFRGEHRKVLQLFAHANVFDRNSERLLDGDHYAALGRTVQFSEDYTVDRQGLGEFRSLDQAVLAQGRVQREIGLYRGCPQHLFAHAFDFL